MADPHGLAETGGPSKWPAFSSNAARDNPPNDPRRIMKYDIQPEDQMIVGTLLEDGEYLTEGVAVLHPAGTGTFQVAEPPVTPRPEGNHVIKDLAGKLWPIGNLSIENDSTVPHYKLTHTITYFEVQTTE